jgi:hypothetical protein
MIRTKHLSISLDVSNNRFSSFFENAGFCSGIVVSDVGLRFIIAGDWIVPIIFLSYNSS